MKKLLLLGLAVVALTFAAPALAGGLSLTGETGAARTPLALVLEPMSFPVAGDRRLGGHLPPAAHGVRRHRGPRARPQLLVLGHEEQLEPVGTERQVRHPRRPRRGPRPGGGPSITDGVRERRRRLRRIESSRPTASAEPDAVDVPRSAIQTSRQGGSRHTRRCRCSPHETRLRPAMAASAAAHISPDLDDRGASPCAYVRLHDVALDLAADLEVQAGQVLAKLVERVEQLRCVCETAGAERELARREGLEDEDAAGRESQRRRRGGPSGAAAAAGGRRSRRYPTRLRARW